MVRKILVSIVFLVVVLVGCNRTDQELRFRSILDNESGEVLVIGDSSERVREVLGEPGFITDSGSYRFFEDYLGNPALTLGFNPELGLTSISIAENSERFEFHMTVDEVRNNFEYFGRAYARLYDANDNLLTDQDFEDDNLAYVISVTIISERISSINIMYW